MAEDGPPLLVDDLVVADAQVGGVEQAGGAKVDPMQDVVQFAERDRGAAARKRAALIP
jgi:hypothetical protein